MRVRAVAVAAVGSGLLAACAGTQSVPITSASTGANIMRVDLTVASCNEHPTVRVSETDERVTLTATIDRRNPFGATNDCLDGATASLDAPLGDRDLIDGSTGEQIPRSDQPTP